MSLLIKEAHIKTTERILQKKHQTDYNKKD